MTPLVAKRVAVWSTRANRCCRTSWRVHCGSRCDARRTLRAASPTKNTTDGHALDRDRSALLQTRGSGERVERSHGAQGILSVAVDLRVRKGGRRGELPRGLRVATGQERVGEAVSGGNRKERDARFDVLETQTEHRLHRCSPVDSVGLSCFSIAIPARMIPFCTSAGAPFYQHGKQCMGPADEAYHMRSTRYPIVGMI